MSGRMTCRKVMIDGVPVRFVRGSGDLAPEDLEALQDVVHAANDRAEAARVRRMLLCADCGSGIPSGYVRCAECIARQNRRPS